MSKLNTSIRTSTDSPNIGISNVYPGNEVFIYDFDSESAILSDKSGYQRNLTNNNGVTYKPAITDQFGYTRYNMANITAQSQNLYNNTNIATLIGASTTTTVSFWVNIAGGDSTARTLIEFRNFGANYYFTIYYSCTGSNTGPFQFQSLMFNSSLTFTLISSKVYSLNTWYHVAMQLGASGLKIYVNGVLLTIANGTLTTLSGTTTATLAGLSSPINSFGLGQMQTTPTLSATSAYVDTLMIYNSYLTATQISTIYNAQKLSLTKYLGGEVAIYDFPGTTTYLQDGSGNAYALTGNASPVYTASLGAHNNVLTLTATKNAYYNVNVDCIVGIATDFTVSLWVYLTSTASGQIFEIANGSETDYFRISYASSIITFTLHKSSPSTDILSLSSQAVIAQTTWYHIVAQAGITGAGGKLWINNVLVDSYPATGSLNALSTALTLWAVGQGVTSSPTTSIVGSIGTVLMYKSYLTQQQINTLYYQGLTTTGGITQSTSFSSIQKTETGNNATNTSTGALTITNGMTVSGTTYIDGNLTLSGSLNVPNLNPYRNKILNGAMAINQRITQVTITTGDFPALDGWRFDVGTTSSYTISQQTLATSDTPYNYGFRNYMHILTTTASTTATYTELRQANEGYNMRELMWGTQYAAPVTLSFWVRTNYVASSITLNISLRNAVNTYSYVTQYTISGSSSTSIAGGWQYVTITIPGANVGAWNIANGCGIDFDLYSHGTDYTTSAANTWASGNFIYASGSTHTLGTNGIYMDYTGVQLEKGTIATPYAFLPYGIELAICQRYFVRYYASTVSGTSQIRFGLGMPTSATAMFFTVQLNMAMRTLPTTYGYRNVSTSNLLQLDWYNVGPMGTTPIASLTADTNRGNMNWITFSYSSGSSYTNSGGLRQVILNSTNNPPTTSNASDYFEFSVEL